MRSGPKAIIAALFIAEVAAIFETTMVYAALPTLIREFGDPLTAGWLVTSHMLVAVGAVVVAGRLGDIFGRRRVMLILLFAALAGSILSASTKIFALVLVGRALQGLSIAVTPLIIGIIRENLPPIRVPVAVGLMTTAQGVGTASGLVLGGVIIDTLNWHWLFAASALLLAIAWIAVHLLVPANPGTPPSKPIDWTEGLMPVPGVTAILLGISMARSNGWVDPAVIGLVLLGIAIIALWARRSLAASEPFIDLRLLASRNVALANFVAIFFALGSMQAVLVFSTFTQNPAWTMAGLGLGATAAGLAKLPSNFLSLFAGPFAGWLQQKFGLRLPIVSGGIIAAIGWIMALGLPETIVQIVLLLCVISFGSTILNAAVPNVIVASVPQERTSEAIGAMSVLRAMFAAIGTQLIVLMMTIETLSAPGGAQLPSPAGFRFVMIWVVATAIAMVIAGLMLRAKADPVEEAA
ncbi:MAG: MFS transporter [Novosphingobium sp.]|nr:MFS transporter [Novosphingobium sp.]